MRKEKKQSPFAEDEKYIKIKRGPGKKRWERKNKIDSFFFAGFLWVHLFCSQKFHV